VAACAIKDKAETSRLLEDIRSINESLRTLPPIALQGWLARLRDFSMLSSTESYGLAKQIPGAARPELGAKASLKTAQLQLHGADDEGKPNLGERKQRDLSSTQL
jgi:hypothetical protein